MKIIRILPVGKQHWGMQLYTDCTINLRPRIIQVWFLKCSGNPFLHKKSPSGHRTHCIAYQLTLLCKGFDLTSTRGSSMAQKTYHAPRNPDGVKVCIFLSLGLHRFVNRNVLQFLAQPKYYSRGYFRNLPGSFCAFSRQTRKSNSGW